MVTAFTGPLVGAAFAGVGDRGDWGNLVMAIDPELLGNRNEFKKNVTLLAKKVKETKKTSKRQGNFIAQSTWKQTYSRTITIRRN